MLLFCAFYVIKFIFLSKIYWVILLGLVKNHVNALNNLWRGVGGGNERYIDFITSSLSSFCFKIPTSGSLYNSMFHYFLHHQGTNCTNYLCPEIIFFSFFYWFGGGGEGGGVGGKNWNFSASFLISFCSKLPVYIFFLHYFLHLLSEKKK